MHEPEDKTIGLMRPVFFDRQSLSKEDLNLLVDYVRARDRRHNRHVVGWGVTCGLAVSRSKASPWAVRVGQGHAVMPSGDEVAVPDGAAPFDVCEAARKCLDIPGPCPDPHDLRDRVEDPVHDPVHDPIGDGIVDDFSAMPPDVKMPNPLPINNGSVLVVQANGAPASANIVHAFGALAGLFLRAAAQISLSSPTGLARLALFRSSDSSATVVARDESGAVLDTQSMTAPPLTLQTLEFKAAGIATLEIASGQEQAFLALLETRPAVLGEVYLALCPDETETCPRPAVPELCQAPGANVFQSRVCEGYRLQVLCELPEGHEPADCEVVEEWICGPAHVPCPPPGAVDCVVIATLAISENGIVSVDEFAHRRRLIPQWVLSRRAECLCGEPQPTIPPTQVTEPTQPTQPTKPTQPTQLTDFTRLTILTGQPSVFTGTPSVFTRGPSVFTGTPSVFTRGPSVFTGTPSVFTRGPSVFTGPPVDTGIVVGPGGGPVFDADRGRALDVEVLDGVGRTRGERLRQAGIADLTSFIERDTQALAEIMGVSEVRVAEMQAEARARTLTGPER